MRSGVMPNTRTASRLVDSETAIRRWARRSSSPDARSARLVAAECISGMIQLVIS